MYLPIFRGRQFELIALRECVDNNLLGNHIIPIIEPVKLSSTYIKTIDSFINRGKKIAIIRNPQVGSWIKDMEKESNSEAKDRIEKQFGDKCIIPALYVNSELNRWIQEDKKSIESAILICSNPEYLGIYENVIGRKKTLYSIIPDKSEFRRRIHSNRVMCEDHFPRKNRNVDYLKIDTEFYSSDHLYYAEDGYEGFSDYSVVGEEYNETGFAPYAVAIHIVYFDEKYNLRIAHFVSDSNDDISDPARKFAEAAEKLVRWNENRGNRKLKTAGIRELENTFYNANYPGLGVIKKYSIMHHLELMGKYLDEVET